MGKFGFQKPDPKTRVQTAVFTLLVTGAVCLPSILLFLYWSYLLWCEVLK